MQIENNKTHFIRLGFLLSFAVVILFTWYFASTQTRTITESGWDGIIKESFTSGNGTEENPYVISEAGELAYLKQLLESEDANLYANKYYKIANSFNYGAHNIAINNNIPFSGTIDGSGNTIYNARVTDAIFQSLTGATIKNINLSDIKYDLNENEGAVLTKISENSTFNMISLKFTANVGGNAFAGLSFKDKASTFENVIIQQSIMGTNEVANFIHTANESNIKSVLIKEDVYEDIIDDKSISKNIQHYRIAGDRIMLNDGVDINNYTNEEYKIKANKEELIIEKNSPIARAPRLRSATNPEFIEHESGAVASEKTIYVNNLTDDYNYYIAKNYTSSSNGRLPTGENQNIYNESNLARVMITYSGIDGELTGRVSGTEDYTTIVYYDWLPVVNNIVDITLIDNPFAYRPAGKGFNGWISNTAGVTVSIDRELYERHAKVSATPNEEGYNDIVLSFHASWTEAKIGTMTNSWANAFSDLASDGLEPLTTYERTRLPYDMTGYLVYDSVTRNQYYTGYDRYGYYYNNERCRSRTCYYYREIDGEYYDEGTTYYYINNNGNVATLNVNNLDFQYETTYFYDTSSNMAGYYVEREFSYNASYTGYYDDNGNPVSGTCYQTRCVYYEYLQAFDEQGNQNTFDETKNYYYLVTRDTNIILIGANISSTWGRSYTKPFTFTGMQSDGTISSYRWNVNDLNVRLYNDTRIEHMIIYSGNAQSNESPTTSYTYVNRRYVYHGTIIANYHNLKIGRGLTRYNNNANFDSFIGGTDETGGNGNDTKYNLVVESGFYTSAALVEPPENGDYDDLYIQANGYYGNDIDRVRKINNNLDVSFSASGSWGGNIRSSRECAMHLTVKSGSFGTGKYDMYSGIYIGGRSYGDHYAARCGKIEGGYIYNLIGGPLTASSREEYNDTYIYQTGGEIDLIIGGAGRSATYGNRIIAVTGGKVNYSVFGGSNGSGEDSTNGDGTVNGSSLIYIGGNATIGNGGTDKLYGAESGSVFGNGNGKSGDRYEAIGSNANSHIIVDGSAHILGSVYGGGNYGATGIASGESTTSTKIEIHGGTIDTNVYGGGNENGAGTTSTVAQIDITMDGGTVKGSIYGGSNIKGTINGNTNVSILNGSVAGNVYGGGKGQNTFVSKDVAVVVGGATANKPTISGSVYGGSALGTVNSTSTTGNAGGNTTVTVNNGVITNNVFGGGEGNATTTPYVLGNITVTINNGDITGVFGGNDQAGSHTKENNVYLNGGTIDAVYGGGNKSSVTNTHVYAQGSTVTDIYGGSNEQGDVTSTTINLSSGTIGNVYGGNNKGGTCGTTNVLLEGTSTITNTIYGGGNEVDTTTTNVTLNSCTGSIPNIFGGGNSASVTTTNVTQNGITATNIFGGSNSSGSVGSSNIYHNSGTTTNVYGGNNEGGSTINAHVDYRNGNSSIIYGGGNKANGQSSTVNVSGGSVTDIFGGGNSAGVTTSNVTITSGDITNVYGGSNNTGTVTTTNVTVDNSNNIQAIYGGGNKAEVGSTNVTVNGGVVGTIYGGGNLAQATGNTNVDLNGGTINNNIYGGGNFGVVKGNSKVTITNSNIKGSAYAGGNGTTAILEGNTEITIDGTSVIGTPSSVAPATGSVFGGGNQAATGTSNSNSSTSTVNIAGGTIYGNVYGGANTSVIYGNTNVNIGYNTINDSTLTKSDVYIKGHIFGGGEANASGSEIYDWDFISVTDGTHINIDAAGHTNYDILGSFYGGGNASSASGDSYLVIKNYGTTGTPKQNVSIQRVTNVTIDNSSILLEGAIDRANEYKTEHFSISRVPNFTIQNNTELYLKTNANLLESFLSKDSSGNYAEVTINTERNTVTKNVNNRLYLYEGINLNIATDEFVTEYGTVKGMTFLGLFNYNNDNTINTGNYHSSYNPGDTLPWAGEFNKGGYVLGSHLTNHDITKDGFYSNFINSETQINEVNYIEPTPPAANFYMWYIGENVVEVNVDLDASKYSTLGSKEVVFRDFTAPNTSFEITEIDTTGLNSGISLVDRNTIPRIASTEAEANTIFGLTVEASNSGWLTNGKTTFYTSSPNIKGTTFYEGDSTTTAPSMLFYLHHSKNVSQVSDLGTVRISVVTVTKKNALSNEVKRLVINVHMTTSLHQTVEYEGAMTPGDKYELFASTTNNITNKSKLSAYYSLYSNNSNVYKPGYHRVLTSNYILPENTKITMLDISKDEVEYYYHIISSTDVANATQEMSAQNEASYPLSMFYKMGSKDTNVHYDDAAKNAIYYDGKDSNEEFIFIVDYSNANINTNELGKTLFIEMRDGDENSIISVLGIERSQLTYNLFEGRDSNINMTVTASDNPLYIGYSDIFEVNVDYYNTAIGEASVIDTQYFDSKLGLQVSILNHEGKLVSGTDLVGSYFVMDNVRYYPDINGITHIKLSDKVGNAQKWVIFNTENSSLATGDYTFHFETFGSLDGIYYSSTLPDTENLDIMIINSTYGLNPVLDDNSVIFTGSGNDKLLKFNIAYESHLDNPNIRLAMYRRRYDEIYDTNYDFVDFADYADQTLIPTNNEKEYMLISGPNPTNEFSIIMKNEMLTGTYRLAFRLYDGDTMIGEIIRYIIIK